MKVKEKSRTVMFFRNDMITRIDIIALTRIIFQILPDSSFNTVLNFMGDHEKLV